MSDKVKSSEDWRFHPRHVRDWKAAYRRLDSHLDPGIRLMVMVLMENGIETCQSCEGGDGHAYPEPTVDFAGQQSEGFRALAVARSHGLKVRELRRVWHIQNGEPVGPLWSMTFAPPQDRQTWFERPRTKGTR